jgi:hypothetical protein
MSVHEFPCTNRQYRPNRLLLNNIGQDDLDVMSKSFHIQSAGSTELDNSPIPIDPEIVVDWIKQVPIM